ncbi:efflux RND transporter permease subunit [Actinocorallia sp. A-T 12471]|nr:efflux RND transporter permease subunit [Actinocorallia sp. A-T 12471]MDX6742805.1 efflux RND transporter permease subunit [Actinocorallia sp. A-T 12471]
MSRISLKHRKLVVLITLAVLAVGAYAIPTLKQQLLPNLSFPAVSVTAVYPGASPEVVEEQIVKPIEDAVKGTEGLDSMSSTSRQSVASILLMFEFGTDTDRIVGDVQQSINRLSARLPASVDPQVMTGSTADLPTLTLAASGGSSLRDLADKLQRSVVPEIQAVDGVNEVTVSGEREQIVQIVPNAAAMASRGLDPSAITAALGAAGKTVPGGSIAADGQNLSVQVGGPISSVKDVQDLWVTPAAAPGGAGGAGASGGPVRLGQIAAVTLADTDATSLTRTNGAESLGLSVTLKHDGSATSVSDEVTAMLPDLEKALGDGAKLTVISDSGPPVASAVQGLVEEGLLGLIMAVLVIVVFLRSGRSTAVTAISIPLSLIVALITLKFYDYSLNMLTLGALTMAVGRVVDDSIVVLENIKRHLGYGEEKRAAIMDAVKEVAGAVTSSTATTVAVFLPIALVGGFVGELFGPFSITVTVAMVASLIVSLTIVPVLAFWFLKVPDTGGDVAAFRAKVEEEERGGLLQRYYVPVIEWAVSSRKTVLIGAVVILVATFAMAGGLKTSFIGESENNALRVTQTLPVGTDLATTDAAADKVEALIKGTEGVESYQAVVGEGSGGMFGGGGTNTAGFTVALGDEVDAVKVQETLEEQFAALGESVGELSVGADNGFGGSSDIQILVNAADDETLKAGAEQIRAALAGLPELKEVTTDLAESAPQISIRADNVKAARAGLSEVAIAQIVGQAIQGSTVSTVTVDGTETDVVIKSGADKPASVAAVRDLAIPTAGGVVKLGDIADVSKVDGSVERSRLDGERTATVSATPVGDDLGKASMAVQAELDKLTPPEGATFTLGGVTADQEEAFAQLGLAILAAILIVFLILVAVFGSIRQTLVLLVSIPFAATGAILLLLITGVPLGVAAMIGLLMLIGIVVTNAIVLVDLINTYREQGMGVHEAVVEGGRRRLRPILMTALATIFALVPMALGITGHGGFISQPLAIVVIGGLLSSTLLTLILIPTLYTMVESRREAKHAKPTPPPTPTPALEPVS